MNTQVFPSQGNGGKKSSYWSKPEGKIGIIFGAICFLAIGYFALPYITTALDNWIHFAFTLAAVAAIFYITVIDRRIFTAFKYLYDLFIKNVFGLIFKLDPFLIAEDYIRDIVQERENLELQIEKVSAQREETRATIIENKREMQKQLDIATAAHKKGPEMIGELRVATAQANRLETFSQRLEPIEVNLGKIQDYLEAVHKNSGYMLQDMENELKIKKHEYKAVTKGNNALKVAMAAMKGDPNKRQLMEDSMDYLKEDMANKLASMKHAIKQSSSVMKTIDLNEATMEAEGLRMLQEYRPELFKLDTTGNNEAVMQAIQTEAVKPITKYDNLL